MQEVLETKDIITNTESGSIAPQCNDIGKKLRRNNVGVGVVYRATCSVNKKVYIGVTSQKLNERINDHINLSRCKNPKYLFNRAIKKYGADSFSFDEIDTYNTIKERNEKEIKHIKDYNSFHLTGRGYNMTLGGDGSVGHVKSPEAIHKIKIARARQVFSQETKNLWSKNRTGRRHTEETKHKISNSKIGHTVADETKEKLRKINSGKIMPEETKKKIAEATTWKINRKFIPNEHMKLIVELYKTLGLHKVRDELKKMGIFISSGRIKRNLQHINEYRTPTEAKLKGVISMTGKKRGKYKSREIKIHTT